MDQTPHDIATPEDIKLLVDSFYARVREDELIGPIFNDVARVDWEHHLPLLYKFWGTLLFRSAEYKGNPFSKHLFLPVDKAHFQRWVSLFVSTVDNLFAGPKAEEAKGYARSIADTFQNRMGLGWSYAKKNL
jgi:hemoglobin